MWDISQEQDHAKLHKIEQTKIQKNTGDWKKSYFMQERGIANSVILCS